MTLGDEYDFDGVPLDDESEGRYGEMMARHGEELCSVVLLRDGSGSMDAGDQAQAEAFLRAAEDALKDAYDEVLIRYGVFQTDVTEVDGEAFYGQTQLETGTDDAAHAYTEGLTMLQSTLPVEERYLLMASDQARTLEEVRSLHPDDTPPLVQGMFYCTVGEPGREDGVAWDDAERFVGVASVSDRSNPEDAAQLFRDAVREARGD